MLCRGVLYPTTGHPDALSYRNVDYASPCAIILGNEGRGVSADLLAGREVIALTIPMAARVESLNVAVSGSIILAEAADHLTAEGVLICEIGRGRALLEAEFPDLPLVWLDTEESQGEVFLVRAADLAG